MSLQSADGKTLKRGEICWTIGVTFKGIYMPCRCKVHSKNPDYSIPDETRCTVYSTYAACQQACDIKNKPTNP